MWLYVLADILPSVCMQPFAPSTRVHLPTWKLTHKDPGKNPYFVTNNDLQETEDPPDLSTLNLILLVTAQNMCGLLSLLARKFPNGEWQPKHQTRWLVITEGTHRKLFFIPCQIIIIRLTSEATS